MTPGPFLTSRTALITLRCVHADVIIVVSRLVGFLGEHKTMSGSRITPEEGETSEEMAIFALLETATKSNDSPNSFQSRGAFHKRLCTFSPATYFAKPAIISPLVCARFGYVKYVNDQGKRVY